MAVTPVRTASTLALREKNWILTPQTLKNLENNDTNDAMQDQFRPHIAAITRQFRGRPLLDRYSTVTSVTPQKTLKALGIPAFWGGVKR